MHENYIRLLNYIALQIDTDEIDYAERKADTMKSYIEYYLEHMDREYKYELNRIIPYEILKEKILDVPFGFGDPSCRDDEMIDTIRCDLYNEIYYLENICKCTIIDRTERDQCWECMVRECGCMASPSCCGWHLYADRD